MSKNRRKHEASPPRFDQQPLPKTWADQYFDYLLYFILAAAAILYASLNPQYRTGVFNDDAVYVISAQDLWNATPSHALLHLKPDYPFPGLPLLLSPFTSWVEPHWTTLEWASIVMTVVSIFLLGFWARRWLTSGQTLAVTVLYAFNPVVARYSGILMPAPYYVSAALVSFLLMGELYRKPTALKALALGFFLGWASLIRAEGVLLLVAVAGVMLFTRPGREIFWVIAIPLIGWIFFVTQWVRTRTGAQTEYGIDVSALFTYWTTHAASAVLFSRDLARVFLIGLLTALHVPRTAVASWIVVMLSILCLAGVITGFRRLWKEHAPQRAELVSLAVFCGLYTVVHLFWHVASKRYALPLLPFILVFLVAGTSGYLVSFKRRQLWMGAGILLLLISYAYKNGSAVHESLWAPDPMKSPPWRSLAWLRDETPPSAKMISPIAPSIFLYTQRFSIQRIVAHNEEKFLYMSMKEPYGYIVDRPILLVTPGVDPRVDPNANWARVRLWIVHNPQTFPVLFSDALEQTTIYRIVYPPGFKEAYDRYIAAAQEYRAGHAEASRRIITGALAAYASLGSADNLLGVLEAMRNNLAGAERAFLRAIALLPDSWTAMINLAALYHQEGKTQEALAFLEKAQGVSVANGEQIEFSEKVQKLQNHWTQNRGLLFIDPP